MHKTHTVAARIKVVLSNVSVSIFLNMFVVHGEKKISYITIMRLPHLRAP